MAYSNVKKFTVDNTKVGGSSGSITDYTMIISGTFVGTGDDPDLRSAGNGGDIQNIDTSGRISGSGDVPADLRFYDDQSGTTIYPYECIDYDPATGLFVAAVKIPTLNKGTDTDVYMHYNDSNLFVSKEQIDATWESNIKGVWHLEASSGTRYDSSGNGNNLTDNNTVVTATGQIATGADFTRANSEYLSITDASQTGLNFTDDFWASFWINLDQLPSTAGGQMQIVAKDDAGGGERSYGIKIQGSDSDKMYFEVFGTATFKRFTSDTGFGAGDVGAWVHIYVDWDASANSGTFYKNGSSQAVTLGGTDITPVDDPAPFTIGARGDAANFFDGVIDEVIVGDGLKDSEFITTIYNNQNSPSTFYSITNVVGGGATDTDPASEEKLASSFMSTNTKFW